NSCPMSTEAIVPSVAGTVLAWETKQNIRWARLSSAGQASEPRGVAEPGSEPRRFPAVAVNRDGQMLIAWTEGMRWNTGGRMRWIVLDAEGKEIESGGGSADGVPAWSLVAAVSRPDGGFVILY